MRSSITFVPKRSETMNKLFFLIPVIFLLSCNQQKIQISNISGTNVGMYAANELEKYLGEMYSGAQLSIAESNSNAHIQYSISIVFVYALF